MFAVLHSLLKLLLLIPINVENYFQWHLWPWKSLSNVHLRFLCGESVGTVFRQYGVKYCWFSRKLGTMETVIKDNSCLIWHLINFYWKNNERTAVLGFNMYQHFLRVIISIHNLFERIGKFGGQFCHDQHLGMQSFARVRSLFLSG